MLGQEKWFFQSIQEIIKHLLHLRMLKKCNFMTTKFAR